MPPKCPVFLKKRYFSIPDFRLELKYSVPNEQRLRALQQIPLSLLIIGGFLILRILKILERDFENIKTPAREAREKFWTFLRHLQGEINKSSVFCTKK